MSAVVFAVPFVWLETSKRTIFAFSSYLPRSSSDVDGVDAAASVTEPSTHSTETVFARYVNRQRDLFHFGTGVFLIPMMGVVAVDVELKERSSGR
jgi:hypothetical protein